MHGFKHVRLVAVLTDVRQSVALASKLEAEWNEIKDGRPPTGSVSNQAAAAATQAAATSPTRHFAQPLSGTDGPMKVLSPMSEDDEAEVKEDVDQAGGAAVPEAEAPEKESGAAKKPPQHSETWQTKMERAVIKLAAEVAALREQITTGREWRAKKERSFPAWIAWLAWLVMKHIAVDFVILAVVLFWMRRRKDPRLEDLVRAALRLGREYARGILPSR